MKRQQAGALTRNHLRDAIRETCAGVTLKEALSYVGAVIDEICDALGRGEDVSLHEFGKYSVRAKRARPGFNGWTRESVTISARRIIRFKPSPLLLRKLNASSCGPASTPKTPTESKKALEVTMS